MKILLAVDGSIFSEAAVSAVAGRPWPPASEVKVLSAFETPSLPPSPEGWAIPQDYLTELERSARAEATKALENAVSKLKTGTSGALKISSDVIQGSPKHVILDEADRWRADLIVVGSHGYRGWERFLLGSVSQAVVSHAKCSVEVVRSRPGEGR